MKRTWLIVFIAWSFTATAIAAESEGLSQQAMESVQQQTREMSALGVPQAQAQEMLTQMVKNQFQKQNRIRAQQVVAATAKAGLPTEPVMSKAMEGMAKQAGEQQILAAMETVRSRYAHAKRVARSLSDDDESVDTMTRAIADSMAAGMKARDMEPVMAWLQTRTRQQTQNKAETDALAVQTMQTVRTMARLGVPSSDVSDTLCQALQNQYTSQEMKQLRHQIASRASQASPQQTASRHAGAIGKGGSDSNGGSGSGAGGSGGGAGGSGGGAGGSGGGAGGSGGGAGGSGGGAGGSGGGAGGSGGGAGGSGGGAN
ncbi:hypothetical protein DSCA_22370 [Desulfosarcina alkanivorans]|uniref:Uncharacterized protein n=1 Tax=Desulfosarcina alkanivorans TaxID=571177 RepID=A0A5K7YUE2_9BACT|nr:hypothetical protein [Desulfosarcina alkanivorans]BBO68307.1 hypothetical protein DSCA_22370 [Desulfosarcina alkanivorans]